jgi:hypothetical protein
MNQTTRADRAYMAGTCCVDIHHMGESHAPALQRRTHATASVSWPTTTFPARHGNPAVRPTSSGRSNSTRWCTAEQRQMYLDAVCHKYDSIESYLRMRCLRHITHNGRATASTQQTEQCLEQAVSLWHSTGGVCAATGRQMVWKLDDVRQRPGDAVVIVPIEGDCASRVGPAPPPIALVCRTAALFIHTYPGLLAAQVAAKNIAPFVLFRRDRPRMNFAAVCKAWDKECNDKAGTLLWTTESAGDWGDFRRRMKLARHGTNRDRQSAEEASTLAEHAIHLMCAQAGRCAISGVVMTLPAGDAHTQASIDRIDRSRPHAPGNVRMTTFAINQATSFLSDAAFDELMVCMAQHCGEGAAAPT